jgi:hypothetical protein
VAGKKVVRDCLVILQMLPKNHYGSFDQNGWLLESCYYIRKSLITY